MCRKDPYAFEWMSERDRLVEEAVVLRWYAMRVHVDNFRPLGENETRAKRKAVADHRAVVAALFRVFDAISFIGVVKRKV